jgi:hypothetical protein
MRILTADFSKRISSLGIGGLRQRARLVAVKRVERRCPGKYTGAKPDAALWTPQRANLIHNTMEMHNGLTPQAVNMRGSRVVYRNNQVRNQTATNYVELGARRGRIYRKALGNVRRLAGTIVKESRKLCAVSGVRMFNDCSYQLLRPLIVYYCSCTSTMFTS